MQAKPKTKPKGPKAELPLPIRRFGPALVLLAMVLIAFFPATQAGFIWDDDDHVETNPSLRSVAGLANIWLWPLLSFDSPATPQYYPVTFTSFWLEYRFWNGQPAGYHWTNLILHAINAILFWRVLLLLQVPGAWLAAAVFAVHPVHVESVAWISERKNLLSTFFYGLAMLAMLRFYANAQRRWWPYAMALACFGCALWSKSVTCSLPAALLLILWWKRGTLTKREIMPLMPFFVVGLVMALVTVLVERDSIGASGEPWNFSFVERTLIAGRALWFYATKLVWPANLTFFYPRWQIDAGAWWQYLFPLAFLGMLALLWFKRQQLGRGPLVAVLIFAGTLFPALGFINYFPMLFSFVADHFQYLASASLIALTAAGLAMGLARHRGAGQVLLPIVTGGVVAILALLTMSQAYTYTSVEHLYPDVIEKNPEAWVAHYNLGIEYMKQQGRGPKYAEAEEHFHKTMDLYPRLAEHRADIGAALHLNLGTIAAWRRRYDEAMEHFVKVTRLDPKQALPHLNMGVTQNLQERFDEALPHFRKAAELDPTNASVRFELGKTLLALGDAEGAVVHLSKAVDLVPDSAPFYHELAIAYEKQWKTDESIKCLRRAVELDPGNSVYHYGLSQALRLRGDPAADFHFREGLRLDPKNQK